MIPTFTKNGTKSFRSSAALQCYLVHQIPRAVEAPAFMHGGKAQAISIAVKIV